METQIVRLDSPYNIVCNKDGLFGLHIATLIVTEKNGDATSICSYPVVQRFRKLGGEVWKKEELFNEFGKYNYHVVCRQDETISLYEIKRVMQFYYDAGYQYLERIPWMVGTAVMQYETESSLLERTSYSVSDYEVELIFEEHDMGSTCIVHASVDSEFFFTIGFATEGHNYNNLISQESALYQLKNLRNVYQTALAHMGVRTITFTTKNDNYLDFVNELNNCSKDGEQS